GHYTFQGRENTVQYMNSHALSPQLIKNIEESVQGTSAYLNFNDLISTDSLQDRKNKEWKFKDKGYATGINIKVAYMNDQDILDRLEEISKTAKGKTLLLEEKVLNPDGTWNPNEFPTLYEQQILIAEDIQKNMKMTEQKVLTKSGDVDLFKGLEHGTEVEPGQLLGHENIEGYKKPIYYQGKNPGSLIIDDTGRVGVQYQEDAFKYMIE